MEPDFIWLPPIPFIQAKHETKPGTYAANGAFNYMPRVEADLIVLHCMEAPEKGNTAENCSHFFAGTYTKAPEASCGYCVDNNSIVQCVKDENIAWHAAGANGNGIGIELAGYAKQTLADWTDAYSLLTMEHACRLSARLCLKFKIPTVTVGIDDLLRAKPRGFTTHYLVNEAYKKGTHWDPGPGFPLDRFVARVAAILAHGAPAPVLGGAVLSDGDVGNELLFDAV